MAVGIARAALAASPEYSQTHEQFGKPICKFQAIEVFGNNGYSTGDPVECFFCDAKLTEIGEGASEIQRMVMVRELLKENEVRR
jgi:alkylation response protein AidB-like acyl-CoA dehydrogenase